MKSQSSKVDEKQGSGSGDLNSVKLSNFFSKKCNFLTFSKPRKKSLILAVFFQKVTFFALFFQKNHENRQKTSKNVKKWGPGASPPQKCNSTRFAIGKSVQKWPFLPFPGVHREIHPPLFDPPLFWGGVQK